MVEHENALRFSEADVDRHFSTEIVLDHVEHTAAEASKCNERVPRLIRQSQSSFGISKLEIQSTEEVHVCFKR